MDQREVSEGLKKIFDWEKLKIQHIKMSAIHWKECLQRNLGIKCLEEKKGSKSII